MELRSHIPHFIYIISQYYALKHFFGVCVYVTQSVNINPIQRSCTERADFQTLLFKIWDQPTSTDFLDLCWESLDRKQLWRSRKEKWEWNAKRQILGELLVLLFRSRLSWNDPKLWSGCVGCVGHYWRKHLYSELHPWLHLKINMEDWSCFLLQWTFFGIWNIWNMEYSW